MSKEFGNSEEHQAHLQIVRSYYEKAQKYYDLMWSRGGLHYGLWFKGTKNRHQAITNEIDHLAVISEVGARDIVLDAGSGTGTGSLLLAEKYRATVIPFNIVTNQLRRTAELRKLKDIPNDKILSTKGDYHFLPFADSSIDIFWALESIEHSDNQERLFKEAYRVLKPDGRIIIAGIFKGERGLSPEENSMVNLGKRAAGAFTDFISCEEVCNLMKVTNYRDIRPADATSDIMLSAVQMEKMCRRGLPFAELGYKAGLVSETMVLNTQWGTKQRYLLESGAVTYNIILAEK